MKFAHLGDLHIGKRVNDFLMLKDQEYVFEQIIDIIKNEGVDNVCIAIIYLFGTKTYFSIFQVPEMTFYVK